LDPHVPFGPERDVTSRKLSRRSIPAHRSTDRQPSFDQPTLPEAVYEGDLYGPNIAWTDRALADLTQGAGQAKLQFWFATPAAINLPFAHINALLRHTPQKSTPGGNSVPQASRLGGETGRDSSMSPWHATWRMGGHDSVPNPRWPLDPRDPWRSWPSVTRMGATYRTNVAVVAL